MKTYVTKVKDIERKWYLVDAAGQTLGRLCSKVATMLMGKNKPIFTNNLDVGDFVIVINAEKVVLRGKKAVEKKYIHHTGYPGGLIEEKYASLLARKPEFVVEKAIRNMLPQNRLGRAMFKKLNVYRGESHPHQAQKPIAIDI
ncbi:MAG: 50S ribosomal protein L13 [Actinobacteria bacterium]|nr:50S ribosomal protein L13 [Actinomycetota bacterium]